MALSRGDRLGPYEIIAPLGAGGMGEVYRASDPRLHREVAIKIANAQFSERSTREARLVAALNHPNICQIYDVGPDYLVMEVVEGPTLAERLQQGPVPLDEALGIARQIGDALEAAHEKGIVHRDLKPGNVKIRPDGTVKVLDFGLAKATEEISSAGSAENSPTMTLEQASRAGAIIGTAAYMAPEQARGKPVDQRADIWAFGVVLFEMLSGHRLFLGETISDTLAAVLTTEPDWKLVPPKFERLLRRCLQRDPKQRLRHIGDARFLLEEDGPAPVLVSRSTLPWKIGTAALALLAAVALVSWWLSPRQPAASILRLSVDLGPEAAVNPTRGASMALSPDGSRIVFVVGQALVKSRLAMRRLDQAKALTLAGTEGAEAPFFSPDGRAIAFFADQKLKKMEVEGGGAPVALCDAPSSREGSWGDDDNIVFAATNLGGLSRVSSNGGTPQSVTELDKNRGEITHRYPQVLPGASAVLFVNGISFSTGEGSIEVQSFKSGKRKTLVPTGAYGRFLPSGHLVYMHLGTLFAAPMDPNRLELTGSPVPVLEDVGFTPGTGTAGFAFSRSGMLVYAASNPEERMRSVGVLNERGNLEPLPIAKARYTHIRASPDGTRVAVTMEEGSSVNLWVYEWASRRLSRFSFLNGNSDNPLWTPDGRHLIFSSDASSPGPGIYSMRADGTGAPQRLVDGPDLFPWSVSSTGLAYGVMSGQKSGTWLLPIDWSDATHVKPGVPERIGKEPTIVFSPDGRWIAYEGSQSGTPQIFVRTFPGQGGPWQIAAGLFPAWSRTGRELLFLSIPDSRITAAGYSVSGDSFVPAPTRVWNDLRVDSFDLMPDGKRAVVIPAAEQKQLTHATFLLNFMSDLRRRVPAGK